jgi:hypothetical protein
MDNIGYGHLKMLNDSNEKGITNIPLTSNLLIPGEN